MIAVASVAVLGALWWLTDDGTGNVNIITSKTHTKEKLYEIIEDI